MPWWRPVPEATGRAPQPTAPGLDDFDARPGSIMSLLRTFVGLHMRDLGGWIAVAHLVALLEQTGAPATTVRSAVSRAKAKGLLRPERREDVAGYALSPGVMAMLERGDATIYSYRRHPVSDGWCLISFSVPEDRRAERYRLRRLLAQLGCGTVADGLAVAPQRLAGGLQTHLREAGLGEWVTVFEQAALRPDGSLAAACARWWDLDMTAGLHRAFIARHRGLAERLASGGRSVTGSPVISPQEAFAAHLRIVDDWRPIPYRDPGLSREALPADWPGDESAALFRELHERLGPPAAQHVVHTTRSQIGRARP